MRLLICGDRNWTDDLRIAEEVTALGLEQIECVIEGEARGADQIGRNFAIACDIPIVPFHADWKQYGRAAGPMRNQRMLAEGKPTYYLAFHANIEESKGTRDMVNRLENAHVPGKVVTK